MYHNAGIYRERDNGADVGVRAMTYDSVVKSDNWSADPGTTTTTVARDVDDFR